MLGVIILLETSSVHYISTMIIGTGVLNFNSLLVGAGGKYIAAIKQAEQVVHELTTLIFSTFDICALYILNS